MSRTVCHAAVAVSSLLFSLAPLAARAAWAPNGSPVATLTGEQIWPRVASDDRGGAFAVWAQQAAVHAQHLLTNGDFAPGWSAAGMVVPPNPSPLTHARIDPITPVSDGDGGMYVVSAASGPCSAHCYGEPVEIFIQRLTASGAIASGWPAQGVQVEQAPLHPGVSERAKVISAGRKGLMVAWVSVDLLNGVPVNRRLCAQAVGSDGSLRWGESGIEIVSGDGLQLIPAIVSDGEGGILTFWGDQGTAGEVRLLGQHVSSRGRLLWPQGGLQISSGRMTTFVGPLAVSDGERGAIVEWQGGEEGHLDLLAARVTSEARRPWAHDVVLCTAAGDRTGVQIAPTADGGAIVAWLDLRNGKDRHVYAQRIMHGGRISWSPSAAPACMETGERGPLALASDGRNGAFIAWGDTRPQGRLYGTRLTRRGDPAPGWAVDGTLVSGWPDGSSHAESRVEGPWITPTRVGHAIVSWDAWQQVPTAGFPDFIEQSFAMLLTPDGPAASQTGAQRPLAPAEPASAPVSSAAARLFALRGVRPNPAPSGAIVSFTLSDELPATLELFDIGGRRLWSRGVGELGRGEHEVRLRDGVRSPPGLYLVRLSQGERIATTRVAIVD